jgi:hypothetical protein
MRYLVVLTLFVALSGCKKTRADYRDDIAGAICAEMQKCDGIGTGKRFENFDDCQVELSAQYNRRWDADSCENKIDPERFKACKARAVQDTCGGNLLDDLSFAIKCGAGDVCTAGQTK